MSILEEFTTEQLHKELIRRLSGGEINRSLYASYLRLHKLSRAKLMRECGALPPEGVGQGYEVCEEQVDSAGNHPGDHICWDRAGLSGTIHWK